eukprot:TRINITY_DN2376_c0_g1_i1.p1 TRINITY_DN2376_c0_g1~~TRINITY_DN2376_c0_g1_i1.p1  ORF type:complete len:811 (+),score=271.42 TRINITY_DN2376_c0_g1_i1:126-2435(+)
MAGGVFYAFDQFRKVPTVELDRHGVTHALLPPLPLPKGCVPTYDLREPEDGGDDDEDDGAVAGNVSAYALGVLFDVAPNSLVLKAADGAVVKLDDLRAFDKARVHWGAKLTVHGEPREFKSALAADQAAAQKLRKARAVAQDLKEADERWQCWREAAEKAAASAPQLPPAGAPKAKSPAHAPAAPPPSLAVASLPSRQVPVVEASCGMTAEVFALLPAMALRTPAGAVESFDGMLSVYFFTTLFQIGQPLVVHAGTRCVPATADGQYVLTAAEVAAGAKVTVMGAPPSMPGDPVKAATKQGQLAAAKARLAKRAGDDVAAARAKFAAWVEGLPALDAAAAAAPAAPTNPASAPPSSSLVDLATLQRELRKGSTPAAAPKQHQSAPPAAAAAPPSPTSPVLPTAIPAPAPAISKVRAKESLLTRPEREAGAAAPALPAGGGQAVGSQGAQSVRCVLDAKRARDAPAAKPETPKARATSMTAPQRRVATPQKKPAATASTTTTTTRLPARSSVEGSAARFGRRSSPTDMKEAEAEAGPPAAKPKPKVALGGGAPPVARRGTAGALRKPAAKASRVSAIPSSANARKEAEKAGPPSRPGSRQTKGRGKPAPAPATGAAKPLPKVAPLMQDDVVPRSAASAPAPSVYSPSYEQVNGRTDRLDGVGGTSAPTSLVSAPPPLTAHDSDLEIARMLAREEEDNLFQSDSELARVLSGNLRPAPSRGAGVPPHRGVATALHTRGGPGAAPGRHTHNNNNLSEDEALARALLASQVDV